MALTAFGCVASGLSAIEADILSKPMGDQPRDVLPALVFGPAAAILDRIRQEALEWFLFLKRIDRALIDKRERTRMNSLTIYSPEVTYPVLLSAQDCLKGWLTTVKGPRSAWRSVEFRHADGTALTINSLPFLGPGGRFSHVLLGTYNFIKHRDAIDTQRRRDLASFLGQVNWLVGVVSTREMFAGDDVVRCVKALCSEVGGMIFTGMDLVLPADFKVD